MAKTKISEFSSTPGNNTDIDSINIAEGCAPSGINNAIRELMAQLKDFQTGAAGDSFNGPIGTSTAAAGAFTTLSASGNVTLAALTSTRVPYASTGGLLVDSANMTFNGTRLTVADLADSGLTSGRVTYASTGGALVDSANLTFDGTTLTAAGLAGPFNGTVGATTASTGAFTTLTTSGAVTHNAGTANGVAYLNGSKVLTTGSALTFDGSILGVSKSDTTNPSLFTVSNPSTTGSFAAAQMALKSYNGSSVVEGLLLSSISNSWSYGTTLANSAQVYTGLANGLALVSESSTGPIRFLVGTGAPEQMRLTSTGLGIGTSSPTAKLNVSGGAVMSRFQTGSAIDGRVEFAYNTTDIGYINMASASLLDITARSGVSLAFGAGGSERMRLDASGNLLVNTTTSSGRLTVQQASSSVPAAYLRNANSFTGGANSTIPHLHVNSGSDTAGNTTRIAMTVGTGSNVYLDAINVGGAGSGSDLAIYTRPSGGGVTERMRLDASGNLGIGTSSPAGRVHSSTGSSGATPSGNGNQLVLESSGNAGLTIATGASSLGNIFFADSGDSADGFVQYDQSGRSMRFGTATAEQMRLTSTGLGIGTSSPDVFGRGYGGTVLGISGASQSALVVNSGTGNAFIEMGVGGTRTMSLTATSSSASIGAIGALPFIINTNGTERARIDSSGNLLVGTTSSSDYRMRVDAPANNHAGVFVGPTAGYASLQVVNTAASGTRNLISFRTAVGGSQVGAITTDGTNTTYSTSSDYRLKNITGPITTSGAYIDSLNPVEGTWKADGSTFVGLIAHEVQEASRTTVATGVKDGEEMQGMDYSSAELIANMLAELKSLRARVAALEAV